MKSWVRPHDGSIVQCTGTRQLQPALGLLPPGQEVMSSKHGCYPGERGQRERKGGAVFRPSLVSQVAAAKWEHYKPLAYKGFFQNVSQTLCKFPTYYASLFPEVLILLFNSVIVFCTIKPHFLFTEVSTETSALITTVVFMSVVMRRTVR